MEYVLLAIKLATKNDKGVTQITTKAIFKSICIIKIKVNSIVITPVNKFEKPIKRPSASWSTSVITLFTMSPLDFESI